MTFGGEVGDYIDPWFWTEIGPWRWQFTENCIKKDIVFRSLSFTHKRKMPISSKFWLWGQKIQDKVDIKMADRKG